MLSVFVIFLNGFQVSDEEIIVFTAVSLFKATFVCTVMLFFKILSVLLFINGNNIFFFLNIYIKKQKHSS